MKYLLRAILLCSLIGVSSCARRELNLVIISGAFAGNNIPQLYESAVEERLGVEANVFSWVRVNEKPDGFHENMRVNSELRDAVAGADVILLAVSPNWSNSAELRYRLGSCGGGDNQDCLRESLANAKCDWKGIMDVVGELRVGKPVVFQVILWGDWIFHAFYGDDATPDLISVMASYYDEFQAFQSSTPGIQTVIIFPETFADLPPGYFRTDGTHQLSDEGSRAAVDLILSPGLVPSQPGSPDLSDENLNCSFDSQ